jgi:hypothetical protein
VPGTTVPGISLAAATRSKRSAGAYFVAALALVLLGAGGTWLALKGRPSLPSLRGAAAPPATAAVNATVVPSVPPQEPPKPVALTAEAPVTTGSPVGAPSVTPATNVLVPEPAQSATAAPSARGAKPARGGAPPPHHDGDQRLGF